MTEDRGYALLADNDQWTRCDHRNTALIASGGVQLTWVNDIPAAPPARPAPSGLVFDRWYRAYRSHPDEGRVSVQAVHGGAAEPEPAAPPDVRCAWSLRTPLGLAVDTDQRLYIAETGAAAVRIVDLWAGRLVRRMPVRTADHPRRRPVDVAATGNRGIALVHEPAGLVEIRGRRGPRPGPNLRRPRTGAGLDPVRIAGTPSGRLLVLWRAPGTGRSLVAWSDGAVLVDDVAAGTDLDVTPDGTLVVAGDPEQHAFRRFDVDRPIEREPAYAADYDGGAIAAAPDGTVAYTTAHGIRWVGGSAARHPMWESTTTTERDRLIGEVAGRVVSYRLDAGVPRTRWGRAFLDACLPPGTDVRVRFLTTDEDDVADPVVAQPPARGGVRVRAPELTPPMPPAMEYDGVGERPVPPPLHRRATGRELPWVQIEPEDRYETYETPVYAEPGRYLWMALDLLGTDSVTPRVRAVRIERPGHPLLTQLPRAFSRRESDASFLHRFLAPAEGLLQELDERAFRRALLFDPHTAPQEMLGWLATFAGLALDGRWSEAARRRLIGEAYPLFRRRGTLGALCRILEIYLGYPPVLLEHWRLRGLGGAVLGATPDGDGRAEGDIGSRAAAALGTTIRVGRTGATNPTTPPRDTRGLAAHTFVVLLRCGVSTEQLAVVGQILDVHRPAHTRYLLREIDTMRVGASHAGLTSMVGPAGAFGPAVLGHFRVGGDGVIGLPAVGSRLGADSAAGQVVVG